MIVLLAIACSGPDLVLQPTGAPPDPADEPAWDEARDLEGVERLFTGPFRCSLPSGTVAAFHRNGMVRDDQALRGRWTHRRRTLTIEADGHDQSYAYEPFVVRGSWHLATPGAVIPCMLGHDAAVPPAGAWLQVVPAGGDHEALGRRLGGVDGVALVTLDTTDTATTGLRLLHPRDRVDQARTIGQAIADRAGRAVTLVPRDGAGPWRLEVGS